MTVADLDGLKSPLKEAEKIQEVLKPLGYKLQGFKKKSRDKFFFGIQLKFVGPSFYNGDKSSPPLPPSMTLNRKKNFK